MCGRTGQPCTACVKKVDDEIGKCVGSLLFYCFHLMGVVFFFCVIWFCCTTFTCLACSIYVPSSSSYSLLGDSNSLYISKVFLIVACLLLQIFCIALWLYSFLPLFFQYWYTTYSTAVQFFRCPHHALYIDESFCGCGRREM